MDTTALGKRLQIARQEEGLTQSQLGYRAGVSQATIAHIESGRNDGSKKLIALAKALNVEPLWLAEGKGKMRPGSEADRYEASQADQEADRVTPASASSSDDQFDTIGHRILLACSKANVSQADLAKMANISPATVNQLINGRNKGTTKLASLAKALGVEMLWLAEGKGSMCSAAPSLRPVAVYDQEEELQEYGEYIFLPELTVKASAGAGTQVYHVDTQGQRQAFTSKWAHRMGIDPTCAATMVVSGDSMEPRLLDGDSIVVDYCQNEHVIDGKVYVLLLNEEVKVKRLFKTPTGGLRIKSDNSAYPDETLAADEMQHIKIIGRVVAVCGGI